MGVTPRPRPVLLGVSTGTVFPSTTVVPETWDWKGSVCAMCAAYSGAHRLAVTTISRTTGAAGWAEPRTGGRAAGAGAARLGEGWVGAARGGPGGRGASAVDEGWAAVT